MTVSYLVSLLTGKLTSLGCETSGHNKVFALRSTSICCLQSPPPSSSVELCAGHDCLESAVLAQVEDLVQVVEVGLELDPVGVIRRPCPILVDLWNCQLVDGYWAIDPSAGIAVLSSLSMLCARVRRER